MVYYFISNVVTPSATIYVGKDKFENEELIKYGWEEDVWYQGPQAFHLSRHPLTCVPRFHADNLSSAHVYLRLAPDQTWDALPPALVEDCAQLTKANSIEGNKQDNVKIIYTPWSNLHKNASMVTGQVGFHDARKTRTVLVPNRVNATVNRLQKTRTIIDADELPTLKETHLAGLRARANAAKKAVRKEEERVARERKEDKHRREHAYEELMHADDGGSVGRSNEQGWDEDDFM